MVNNLHLYNSLEVQAAILLVNFNVIYLFIYYPPPDSTVYMCVMGIMGRTGPSGPTPNLCFRPISLRPTQNAPAGAGVYHSYTALILRWVIAGFSKHIMQMGLCRQITHICCGCNTTRPTGRTYAGTMLQMMEWRRISHSYGCMNL